VAENTLPSIQKALDLGVDAIEIDVFKCASGELVVFHDATLDHLTDGTGDIMQYSLEELKKVKVLGAYQIPTLDEVLDLIGGRVILNIELKGPDTAKPTYSLLASYFENSNWTPEAILISSFNWEELRQYRKLDAEAALAILIEVNPMAGLPIAKELNAVAINPKYSTLTLETVERLHKKGYKVYPWTVNSPTAIKKMKAFGVDGIITDYPERIQK
jgi:glycerophosphoryl diester phosphodiesterase